MGSIEAIAPATSANLGAGFDVFGVALDALFDFVKVEVVARKGIEISVEGIGADLIPIEPHNNTAGVVAERLLNLSNQKCGLRIKIRKGIRPGSGLGSSAASAAAAVLAINEVLNLGLSSREMIKFAAEGEIASAGTPHADNVTPALLGLFTIVVSYNPLEVIQLPSPENVNFVVVLPELIVETGLARSVLPKTVELSDLVYNVGHATAFIAGVTLNDVDLMGRAMNDSVVEPARSHLIPGLAEVKRSAMEAGAAGVSISGAGPSILALVNAEKNRTNDVAKAMKGAFTRQGIRSMTLCTKPGPGAKIVRGRNS